MANRLTQQAKMATVVTTLIKLSTGARRMLLDRAEEGEAIRRQVAELVGTKKKPGRSYRLRDEVAELFRKEKQGKALVKGCEVDGYSYKLVTGKRKVFDQEGFMAEHGLSQADFDAFTTEEDSEAYVKITKRGSTDE